MPLETTHDDGIATVRLDHGPVNALDLELCEAIAATFEELGRRDDVGAVVLTGNGRAFSAGVDLVRILDGEDGYGEAFLDALARCFLAVHRIPRPTVAAVDGHAIAGGCVLACACDRGVAVPGDARIGLTELAVGVPFPTSAIEIVRGRLGERAAEAVLLADLHTPEDARRLGFVDELAGAEAVHDRAVEIARRLAEVPAVTYALTKEQLQRPVTAAIDAMTPTWEPRMLAGWESDEVRTAVERFVEQLRR